ncbi:MAG: XkdX family protein [Clostridia bacterium]|nr:XkdX family protein [Clostridia bacterium]
MAKKAEQHSPRFEYFKNQYEHNYITKATLRKWVKVGLKKPDQGITAAEYEEITGEPYES